MPNDPIVSPPAAATAAYDDDDVCPEATGERCKVGVLDRDGQ